MNRHECCYDGINSLKFDWVLQSYMSDNGDRYTTERVRQDKDIANLVKYGHGYNPYNNFGRLLRRGMWIERSK